MKIPLLKNVLPLVLILLILVNPLQISAQVQTGKSYINVSKNLTGGTFEPGDTLEIRAAIAVGSFSAFSITQVRYTDTIGANFTYLAKSIKIITNEGLIFRSYTDNASDDPAMFNNVNKTLRVNMGKTAGNAANTGNTAATGGTIAYNDKPSFYGGVCIMVASFRVKINSLLAYNTLINLPGGAFRYTDGGNAKTVSLSSYNIMLFQNIGVCPNYVGGNAVIENNGTFSSGITQNRGASAIVPGYSFVNFAAGQPNDGSYGICNNSSATGATDNTVPYPHGSRVFTVWDIIGDHTGAASTTVGNPATAVGTNGGYMAVVNASYATSPAIQQTVANLCPATYYDFSAWFRNICSKCSCDSNGKGALDAAFNGPYPPGVKPNLTYQLNGVDYYTTGDIAYDGQWVRKGFTYLTGAAQTGFTLSIRNNSPGGGGNDWAVDDINLSTCEPDLLLKYSPQFNGCDSSLVDLSSKIRCFFPNYIYYKWEKSTNGGTIWFNTGVSGVGVPTLVSGQWEYTAVYPTFVAHPSDSGSRYRAVVATTAANLTNPSCSYSNSASTMLNIMNCGHILNVNLIDFNGATLNDNTQLRWVTSTERNISHFEIEKSEDAINFHKAGIINAYNTGPANAYGFYDSTKLKMTTFYRIKMINNEGLFIYSNTISVTNKLLAFRVVSVTNPFSNFLTLDYIIPVDDAVNINLYDIFGRLVSRQLYHSKKGYNKIKMDALDGIAKGVYIISIVYKNNVVNKKIIK